MSAPTPPITYTMQVDLDRTGDYSSPIADITRYVKGTLNFQYGIQAPYEEVSAPSRMTFTVTNVGGEFSREYVGSERVTNGSFSSWAAGVPTGWSVVEGTAVLANIDECGADETVDFFSSHSGTGACGFWCAGGTDGSSPLLTQTGVFVPGKTYRVSIPITAIKMPAFAGAQGYLGLKATTNGSVQIGPLLSDAHDHIFYRYFAPGQTDLKIGVPAFASDYHAANATIDNVSVKEVALYRQVDKNVLVRLRATYLGTTVTIWEGKITDLVFTVGSNAEPTLTITAEDAMLQLLDKEYTPALETSVTADTILNNMFEKGDLFTYPYDKVYWLLGVEGSSELDYTTTLPAAASTSFETGVHTFAYAGDAADRGQGINAQQYIRDVVAAEVGRFFWDVRNSRFVLHNRQHDTLNDVSQVKATFVESDLDSVNYSYGQDLRNNLTIEFTTRTVGAASSVIWSALNLPILLKQNTSKKITARYFDATETTLKIGATDYQPIRNGVDIVANTASNGSGNDMTNSVTMTADCGATAATVYINNGTTTDVYITTLQLRGTPLINKQDTYSVLDGASRRNYDEYPKTLSIPLMDDIDDVKNYADYQVSRFKTAFSRLESITFNALRNATTLNAAQNRVIGDRITVKLNNGHDADYFIVGEQRSITIGGDKPAAITWILEPALRKLFWVLGTTGQSEMGETTILGF